MPERKNPETSLAAYRSLEVNQLNEIYQKILAALSVITEGTFEDISAWLHVDKSRVWKRLSEMERMQLVYRPGNKRILKSGRFGYTWMLTNGSVPKTEKQQKELLKGTKSISEIAGNIAKIGKNLPVQGDIFSVSV